MSGDDLPEGDFLLQIIVYSEIEMLPPPMGPTPSPPIYQAQLFEAKSMRPLMRDGPPHLSYSNIRPKECSRYRFSSFTIDDRGAYASPQKLSNYNLVFRLGV